MCLPESGRLQISDCWKEWLSVRLLILSVPGMGTYAPVKINLRFAHVSKVKSSGHSETPKKVYKGTVDLVYDRICFAFLQNLKQEFLHYEITDFLFLSSRVFLRSCSFDLQYWKPVFSFQEPQIATSKIHTWKTWQPFWIEYKDLLTNKADWDLINLSLWTQPNFG